MRMHLVCVYNITFCVSRASNICSLLSHLRSIMEAPFSKISFWFSLLIHVPIVFLLCLHLRTNPITYGSFYFILLRFYACGVHCHAFTFSKFWVPIAFWTPRFNISTPNTFINCSTCFLHMPHFWNPGPSLVILPNDG